MTVGEILDEIDSTLDHLDMLVHKLNLKDSKALTQKIYDFYADVERKVNEA